jgi:hypothetical protein
MSPQELLTQLRAFAVRTKSETVDLRQFVASLPKVQGQQEQIEAMALGLADKAGFVVNTEAGRPRVISFPDYHVMALVDEYRQLSVDASKPFPREDTAPAPLPAGQLIVADVKAQLGALLETSAPGMKGVVKLQFPEGVDPLIVPQESVGTDLVDAAMARISRYLQDGKNQGYAEAKLVGALKGNEVLVRQTLQDAVLRPKKAAAAVLNPTEFGFKFWTHLSNLVLQDMRAKPEKTDQDQGACQSAFIIGYAVFHKKGAVQREQEWAADRKSLEGQVRKAPFVFGFQDLYQLKDAKGATYVAKHSRDFIHSFLKEKSVRSGEETIPYLVRVHAAAQKKDYFIQRDLLVPVYLKKLTEASEELRTQYLNEWTEELREDRTPAAARNDAEFRRDVEIRVKEGFPLLAALSNGGMLYLAGDATNLSQAAKDDLRKCFAVESILRPFDELLGLARPKLLKDVRIFLPFWLTMPVVSAIVRLFRLMFRGKQPLPQAEESADSEAEEKTAKHAQPAEGETAKNAVDREDLLRYRRGIQSLISAYVPKGKTIDGTLAELAERWNPLYDAEQKRNLVEDVNSLARDFLRPIRRSFLVRPPDLKRIRALAEQLSTSRSLVQIKKRDVLIRYIELYMIRSLQVKKL